MAAGGWENIDVKILRARYMKHTYIFFCYNVYLFCELLGWLFVLLENIDVKILRARYMKHT